MEDDVCKFSIIISQVCFLPIVAWLLEHPVECLILTLVTPDIDVIPDWAMTING